MGWKQLQEREELQTKSFNASDAPAIAHLKQAIARGRHWYIALLEAIGLWRKAEECYNERHYKYLIGGEAFDWLLLAERLCLEVDDLIPEQEKIDLLFHARPPLELSPEEFKRLIGDTKYRAYLNYWYGVVVEEMLLLAVEDEVYKEHHPISYYSSDQLQREAYGRVYAADLETLLQCFRQEKGWLDQGSITLGEMKEFTYWLFGYRLKNCDKEKVASDTKKALTYMQGQLVAKGLSTMAVNYGCQGTVGPDLVTWREEY